MSRQPQGSDQNPMAAARFRRKERKKTFRREYVKVRGSRITSASRVKKNSYTKFSLLRAPRVKATTSQGEKEAFDYLRGFFRGENRINTLPSYGLGDHHNFSLRTFSFMGKCTCLFTFIVPTIQCRKSRRARRRRLSGSPPCPRQWSCCAEMRDKIKIKCNAPFATCWPLRENF